MLRTTVGFAAGVVVGAAGREALSKLKEQWPELKEQWSPLVATAMAGVRDAAGDAATQVARTVASVQDAMAQHRPAATDTAEQATPAA